jgi:integrator complex subunit 1
MLKSAQKSIMLWDPDGPARKPPREAADILLTVVDLFGLSNSFQHATDPDFVLLTVGKSTRGAIERAYDWLIPVISNIPETIARLPSNASCFLLLRAYGTDGEERSQLRQLSTPLLIHVKESLEGRYGEADAVNALDLLMSDVASHVADRRRCARRVLNDALGRSNESANDVNSSWMLNILLVKDAKALIKDAVKHMVSIPSTFIYTMKSNLRGS